MPELAEFRKYSVIGFEPYHTDHTAGASSTQDTMGPIPAITHVARAGK
jgi:hypothetical protein